MLQFLLFSLRIFILRIGDYHCELKESCVVYIQHGHILISNPIFSFPRYRHLDSDSNKSSSVFRLVLEQVSTLHLSVLVWRNSFILHFFLISNIDKEWLRIIINGSFTIFLMFIIFEFSFICFFDFFFVTRLNLADSISACSALSVILTQY